MSLLIVSSLQGLRDPLIQFVNFWVRTYWENSTKFLIEDVLGLITKIITDPIR